MRLLQVCNVGRLLGGTGACAWTITRAFPDWEHDVVFLSVADGAVREFAPARVDVQPRIDAALVARLRPDVVLLHNTGPQRCPGRLPAWTVHYAHSVSARAAADTSVVCSHWLQGELRRRCGDEREAGVVLHQPVSVPVCPSGGQRRRGRNRLVVGRLCTPTAAKWPEEQLGFYEQLARRRPDVDWEFVGCPSGLQRRLARAVRGRARFHPASRNARALLWDWDVLLYHHPTLTESFGRTAAEAMRAGCIPVVDARGGFIEQMAPGTGLLCSSTAEYVVALGRLPDPIERRRRSMECRRHADAAFSLARFRGDFLRLLRGERVPATATARS